MSTNYYGSTTGAVVVAGSIIKAKKVQQITKKYKRKDCPVCKGKGWHMSGDDIKKIDCTDCEVDESSISINPKLPAENPTNTYSQPNCTNGKCQVVIPNNSIIIRK
jgi:hypothetical protein